MIKDIRLQNFRSYQDETFEFTPGVNIIVGPNASGKTNLLEGLLLVASGKSYRAKDAGMVRHKAPWARLDAHTDNDDRTVKLKAVSPAKALKSFEIEKREYGRLPHTKTLPAVLFEPDHLMLLKGSPEQRREFIDRLLDQTHSGYGALLRQYKRALAQRNALLKSRQEPTQKQLFPWDVRLSELAGQVIVHRLELVARLNDNLTDIYSRLAGKKTKITANYETRCDTAAYASSLLRKLEADAERDRLRGFTGAGLHRDDLVLELEGHRLQEAGSRGETRTLLLGLKINELQLIEEARGKKPILLLDDVFSELDGARRQALTSFIKDYQTYITTTDADVVVQHFIDNCRIIPTIK